MIENDRDPGLGEESSVADDDTSPGTPMTFDGHVLDMPGHDRPEWDSVEDTGVTPFDPDILEDDSDVDEIDDHTSIQPPNHEHFLDDADEAPSDHTDVVTMDFFENDEDEDGSLENPS